MRITTVKEELMLRDIPDYGDHMTLEDFVNSVDNGLFTDDDGHGYYANAKQMSTESYSLRCYRA